MADGYWADQIIPLPCQRLDYPWNYEDFWPYSLQCLSVGMEVDADAACGPPPCHGEPQWPLDAAALAAGADAIDGFTVDFLLYLDAPLVTCAEAFLTQAMALLVANEDITEYICCMLFGDRVDPVSQLPICYLLLRRATGDLKTRFHLHDHTGRNSDGAEVCALMGTHYWSGTIEVFKPFFDGYFILPDGEECNWPDYLSGCPSEVFDLANVIHAAGSIFHEMVHQATPTEHDGVGCDEPYAAGDLFVAMTNARYGIS